MISFDLATAINIFLAILIGMAVLGILFALLPTGDLPEGASSLITWVTQQLTNWDFIIPVATIFEILVLIILIETLILSFRVIVLISRLLSGKKTKSA